MYCADEPGLFNDMAPAQNCIRICEETQGCEYASLWAGDASLWAAHALLIAKRLLLHVIGLLLHHPV